MLLRVRSLVHRKALHTLKCVGLKPPTGKSYEYLMYSPYVVKNFLSGACHFVTEKDNGGLDVMSQHSSSAAFKINQVFRCKMFSRVLHIFFTLMYLT